MAEENKLTNISQARSIAEMSEFWDTHDATDFDDQTYEVAMEFEFHTRRHYIAIDPGLLTRLHKLARARGISLESLANLWLQERALASES